MKAIIPAAGRGTRFLPVTKAIPKEMLPVLSKPVIQYVVEEAAGAGADEVIIVNSREKSAIERHFAPDTSLNTFLASRGKSEYLAAVSNTAGGAIVSFTYQDEPSGLGHAVLCGMRMAGEDDSVFVLLGDTIVSNSDVLKRMRQISAQYGQVSVIAVVPVPREEVSRFGVIKGIEISDEVMKIEALVEKPSIEDAPSNLAIFGRYLLTPAVRDVLEHTTPGAGGEIQLTDALQELLVTEDIYALVIDPEVGFDTGTIDAWLDTNNRFHAKTSATVDNARQ